MYSSVLEAHIEVLQGLQKVSAYTEDMFFPEEIDLHLNRQQNRLLEQIVNKKFEDTQAGLDYIRPLVVKNKSLKVLIPQSTDSNFEPEMVYGVFPGNYYHLINDRSKVITSTVAGLCEDLSAYKTANQSDYSEFVAVLKFPETTATVPPQYYNARLIITKAGTPITITIPAELNVLKSSQSWFTIANYFLDNLKFTGLDVYWETYRDISSPKSFVFVSSDNTITQVQIAWQVSGSNPALAGNNSAVFTETVYKTPNYLSSTLSGYKEDYVPNLLLESDEFYEQNLNVFYRTNKRNPKSQVTGSELMAYEKQSFLISNLYVDYIRKPKHVSLFLNQNFELAGDAPRIVVDRTIEYLKLAIENPAYREVVTDNQLRNQI